MAAPRRRSRGAIIFLLVWLALLTGMMALVVAGWSGAAPAEEAPPMVWLLIGLGGWIVGALLLRRALRGERGGGPEPRRTENGPGESDRGFD